ncbi:MAG: pentapeptide repeat-containing protein [Caldilineaceae bacterium]
MRDILRDFKTAISDLVANHNLHRTPGSDPLRALARAHLFVALNQMDGHAKGLALQFLYEANLIGNHVHEGSPPLRPLIALNGANLVDIVLPRANLAWSHFVAADLSRADLRGTYLLCANLSAVDLVDADLTGANLVGANLFLADLTNANFDGADLTDAKITPAQLKVARITETTRLPEIRSA